MVTGRGLSSCFPWEAARLGSEIIDACMGMACPRLLLLHDTASFPGVQAQVEDILSSCRIKPTVNQVCANACVRYSWSLVLQAASTACRPETGLAMMAGPPTPMPLHAP